MPSSNVGTDTGLPVDPLVGLGILRDSSSRKITFRLFPVLVESNLASPSSRVSRVISR